MANTMDGITKTVPSTMTFMSVRESCDSRNAIMEGALT